MSRSPKDADYMRCMHCQKVIRVSRCDPTCLLRHVEQDHPSKCTVASKKSALSSPKSKDPASSVMSQISEKMEQFCEKNRKKCKPAFSEGDQSSGKIQRMHMLAAQHGISEERLSEISRKTGLSEAQMADKAEAYMAKKKSSHSAKGSGGCEKDSGCPTCQCGGSEKEQAHRKQSYRLSIKRWVPAEGCLYCPCCGCRRRPLIKAASELVTTRCCATCILVCWPLRLLPCLVSSDNREYLYCSKCSAFLGIYEREKRCVRPSKEFLTCCNSVTPPATPK